MEKPEDSVEDFEKENDSEYSSDLKANYSQQEVLPKKRKEEKKEEPSVQQKEKLGSFQKGGEQKGISARGINGSKMTLEQRLNGMPVKEEDFKKKYADLKFSSTTTMNSKYYYIYKDLRGNLYFFEKIKDENNNEAYLLGLCINSSKR